MAQKLTEAQWNARREVALAAELPEAGIVQVEVAGTTLRLPALLREFSTGSRGYSLSERLSTEHGAFQVNVTVTQVGSGPYKGK